MTDLKRFLHATFLAVIVTVPLGAVLGMIESCLHQYVEAACLSEKP